MGQSRSSVLLQERNGAFSDILHTNPHLVGRSHPVSVEVREFDWDSSRKGASQLPRTKTIRLSTQKTTTGENLILGYTSPLTWQQASPYARHFGGQSSDKKAPKIALMAPITW